jgi:hypothetical protein
MPIIDNIELYNKVKQIADEKYPKPSAYKSGFIVKTYKSMGGTYSGKKSKVLKKAIAEVEGDGLGSFLTGAVNDVKHKVDYVNSIIHGRKDYSPSMKKILTEYGDLEIRSITVNRNPIQSALINLIDFVSRGSFKERLKNTPYDKLYHLRLEIGTDKGVISLEKTEVPTMGKNPHREKGSEQIAVPINKSITVRQLVDTARHTMGEDFFKYSAKDCNCQDFSLRVLKANNLGNGEIYDFIKQKTDVLFDPTLRKIANTATELAGRFDVIRQGGATQEEHYQTHNPYESMKHGALTNQLNTYNRKHKTQLDLYDFSKLVEKEPEKFNKITLKRARFYLNFILHGEKPIRQGGGLISLHNVLKKRMNPWIHFVKSYCEKHNCKYSDAIKSHSVKEAYHNSKRGGDLLGDIARQGAKSLIDVGANALKQSLGGKVKRGGHYFTGGDDPVAVYVRRQSSADNSKHISHPDKYYMDQYYSSHPELKGGDLFGDMARQGAKSLIDVGANALKNSLGGKVKKGGNVSMEKHILNRLNKIEHELQAHRKYMGGVLPITDDDGYTKQSNSKYKVINAGKIKKGGLAVNEIPNQTYLGDAYNDVNLGQHGKVKLPKKYMGKNNKLGGGHYGDGKTYGW